MSTYSTTPTFKMTKVGTQYGTATERDTLVRRMIRNLHVRQQDTTHIHTHTHTRAHAQTTHTPSRPSHSKMECSLNTAPNI